MRKNPILLRQEAGALLDEAKNFEKIMQTRSLTAWEERRVDQIADKVESLLREAEQIEGSEEGWRGVKLERSGGVRRSFSSVGGGNGYRSVPDTVSGIYCDYLRRGDDGTRSELYSAVIDEYRASNATSMNITTAADGGDLVPTGHYQGIIARARPTDLTQQLPIRMIPGQGTVVNVPVDNESDDGKFVSTAESAEFDLDAPAVSKVALTLTKYTKRLDITYELLEDEDSRLLEYLETYVGQGYAATVNNLMIAEALANGTAALTLDAAAAIGAAEIPELLYTLPDEYSNGGVAWLMRRATEGILRGKTGDNFQFAPTPGGNLSSRAEIFGIPVYNSVDMPTVAAGNKSLLIANWNYMLARFAPGMTLLRDPYTRSSYGEVRLNYHFRCDFAVGQAAAFRYATNPTA